MGKWFVSSDIHSFFDIFYKELLSQGFEVDNPEHNLIICGDLFDRGDQTVQLFEFVKSLGDRFTYIKGNHEDLLWDCVAEISAGRIPSSHHFSNGTVKTICQFCGQSEWIMYDPTWRDRICATMLPILEWINEKCVNYVESNDFILVHSWIPTINKDGLPAHYTRNRKFEFNPDWRNATQEEWDAAAWGNPFAMAERGLLPDKTVVFGHWHCSTGWAKSEGRGEFGEDAKFEPYYGDGFIALDACTAYSGRCNVIVLEDK